MCYDYACIHCPCACKFTSQYWKFNLMSVENRNLTRSNWREIWRNQTINIISYSLYFQKQKDTKLFEKLFGKSNPRTILYNKRMMTHHVILTVTIMASIIGFCQAGMFCFLLCCFLWKSTIILFFILSIFQKFFQKFAKICSFLHK